MYVSLFSGTPPMDMTPEGHYPTIVKQQSGAEVLVLQDYTFGMFLGHLVVTFDDAGNVIDYEGNPILLNNSYPEGNDKLIMILSFLFFECKNAQIKEISKYHKNSKYMYINTIEPQKNE